MLRAAAGQRRKQRRSCSAIEPVARPTPPSRLTAGRRRARAARRAGTRSRWYENIPVRELARAARPLLGLQGADLGALPAGRARSPARCSRWSAGTSAPQPVDAAVVRLRCALLVALAVHRLGHHAAARRPDPAAAVGRPRRRRARLDRSRCRDALWGAVAGYLSLWSVYWLFKLADRQGRHGLRRLQAAGRARRLARAGR